MSMVSVVVFQAGVIFYVRNRTSKVCVLGNTSVHPLTMVCLMDPSRVYRFSLSIYRRFSIAYHVYADDTLLYVSYNPKFPGAILRQRSAGLGTAFLKCDRPPQTSSKVSRWSILFYCRFR